VNTTTGAPPGLGVAREYSRHAYGHGRPRSFLTRCEHRGGSLAPAVRIARSVEKEVACYYLIETDESGYGISTTASGVGINGQTLVSAKS
jgi:hypothetical protein